MITSSVGSNNSQELNMKQIIFLLFITIIFFGCSSSSKYFSEKYSDKYERIKQIDNYFVWVDDTKDHIPFATPNNWFLMQEGFFEAFRISQDTLVDKKTSDYAKYVLAFGYYTSGFYDFCATIQENLLNEVNDSLKNPLLKDMARNYEMIGNYEKYLTSVKERIKSKNTADLYDYNDLAVGFLKTKKYQECIDAINNIPLSDETAITRVTSASAYGYRYDYQKAREELKRAIQKGNQRAKKDYDELINKGDSLYWIEDYKKIVLDILPSNLISHKELAIHENILYSKYAAVKWFDEVFSLYGGALYKVSENISQTFSPQIPSELSGVKYSFILVRGVPFLTMVNVLEKNDFIEKINKYIKSTESKSKYLMLNDSSAIFYDAGWQAEMIKEAFNLNKD